eukprot:8511409-Pyramimonas_sp.AAC.1
MGKEALELGLGIVKPFSTVLLRSTVDPSCADAAECAVSDIITVARVGPKVRPGWIQKGVG